MFTLLCAETVAKKNRIKEFWLLLESKLTKVLKTKHAANLPNGKSGCMLQLADS